MPSHDERSWVRPIPGAFGLERSKEAWERRNRPNAQYLTKTGYYADKLYIYVDEEYGYRSYLWVYPGTPEELVDDWCAGRVPWSSSSRWNNSNKPQPHYRGEFDSVSFQTVEAYRHRPHPRKLQLVLAETGEVIEGFSHLSDFDGQAHVHEQDDSGLTVGFYDVHGIRPAEVSIRVLDAMAAI